MSAKKVTRRELLKLLGTTTAASALMAACGGAATQAPAPTTASNATQSQQPTDTAAAAATSAPAATEASTATAEPAATAAASGPTKVVLMYNANEISDPEIADFNKKNAPLHLERIDTDLVKFFSMVAAGTQVDGIRLQGPNIPAYATKKVTLDLTDFFANSKVLKVDDLFPVNDLFVYKGKRYGMVKDWSPDFSIWINKKLWGEAGVKVPDSPTAKMTYQDWRALSPKLTKKQGDQVIVWGTDFEPLNSFLFWATTTFDPPQTLFNTDFTKLVLKDNKDTYEAIKFFTDWQKEKGLPSAIAPAATQGGWSGADWQAAQAATTQWGYWFSGMVESDKVKGEDVMMMRAPQWGPTYTNPCVSGTGMFLNAKTPDKNAAWKMFEWFMGEEPAQNRAKSGWGVPGLKSLAPLMPQDKPWRKQVYDMVQWELQNSKVSVMQFTPYTYPDAFAATWTKYVTQYLKGGMGFDDFIVAVEKEVNSSIQEGVDAAS